MSNMLSAMEAKPIPDTVIQLPGPPAVDPSPDTAPLLQFCQELPTLLSPRAPHDQPPCLAHLRLQHDFRNGIFCVTLVEVKNLPPPKQGVFSIHQCGIAVLQVDGYGRRVGKHRLHWRRTAQLLEQGRNPRWTERLTLRRIFWNPDRLVLQVTVTRLPNQSSFDKPEPVAIITVGPLGSLFTNDCNTTDLYHCVSSKKHTSRELFEELKQKQTD